MKTLSLFFFGFLALVRPVVSLAGMTSYPDSLPDIWHYTENLQQQLPSEDNWWAQFDDKVLNELLLLAEQNNYDLRAAYQRIAASRAMLLQARSGYYPTIGVAGGWNREKGSGALTTPTVSTKATDYLNLGLTMNWEIDIFGRVRDRAKAAKGTLDASEAEYAATQIMLATNVATAYVELRETQAELSIAREHIKSQEKVVSITEARAEAGIGNHLEISQAKQVLISTQATLPGLQARIESLINNLALLCGVWPDEINERLTSVAPLPILLTLPDCGLPADLIRRRPDIVEAEAQAAAAAARLGVSKKEFLPTLSLGATAGTEAHRAGDLFSNHSFTYSVAPQLSWTIFEGFARKAAVAEARAEMEEAIANYDQTVHQAVEEVNSAMATLCGDIEGIKYQVKLLDQTRETLRLSMDLYKRGLTQFSNVVDAQISVLQAEDALVATKAESLISALTLYRALGGGWELGK